MSDTNIQMKYNYNQEYNEVLKIFNLRRKTILKEIKHIKEKIKKDEKIIYIGFQNIDINWYFQTLKIRLKENMKIIQEIESKLIFC